MRFFVKYVALPDRSAARSRSHALSYFLILGDSIPRTTGRRFFAYALCAAVILLLLLKFLSPGYIDPLAPYHLDQFVYVGMSAEHHSLTTYLFDYARPLSYLLSNLFGRMGVRLSLLPSLLCLLGGLTLLALYIERALVRPISWIGLVLFFAVALGHPQAYWAIKEDLFAIYSFACLAGIFLVWERYVRAARRIDLLFIALLIVAIILLKESYFLVLAAFFLCQTWFHAKRKSAALWLFGFSSILIGLALLHTFHASIAGPVHESFPLFSSSATNPYYTDLRPSSILRCLHQLADRLLNPQLLCVLPLALAISALGGQRSFTFCLLMLLFALLSLLPNSTTPNHLVSVYAALSVPFVASVLLIGISVAIDRYRRWQILISIAALVALTGILVGYHRVDQGAESVWLRQQEQIERNCLTALPVVRAVLKPHDLSLVVGANWPYSPFRVDSFLNRYMGPQHRWTIVIPQHSAFDALYGTNVVEPGELHPLPYDHLFIFAPDGHLAAKYDKCAIKHLQATGILSPNDLPTNPAAQNP